MRPELTRNDYRRRRLCSLPSPVNAFANEGQHERGEWLESRHDRSTRFSFALPPRANHGVTRKQTEWTDLFAWRMNVSRKENPMPISADESAMLSACECQALREHGSYRALLLRVGRRCARDPHPHDDETRPCVSWLGSAGGQCSTPRLQPLGRAQTSHLVRSVATWGTSRLVGARGARGYGGDQSVPGGVEPEAE